MARIQEAIRCTLPNCRCECFSPGKHQIRTCDSCKHGWVTHALDKLGYRSVYQLGMQVEIVQPDIVFDIASLMLYGAQATPIRLKILLDRLFSVLQHEEVLQVLHGFGWTYEDYARGYILQDATSGRVLDKWNIATRDEEQVILQQFMRFGETKSIAQEIILSDTRENRDRDRQTPSTATPNPKSDSEIKKFIERSNLSIQHSYLRNYGTTAAAALLVRPTMTYPTTSSSNINPRMLSPTAVMQAAYSPANSGREAALALSMQAPSPIASSPLTRLQGMQPFDYRRDTISPLGSPNSDKSLAPSSLSSKSPENLSMVTSSSTSPGVSLSTGMSLNTTPVSTPTKQEMPEDLRSPMHCSSDGDDCSDMVLNYSTKSPAHLSAHPGMLSISSVYADKKIKHLRKSSNPMKRQWQPNPAFGQSFISPSGKKRVLCTACNKTFCDKGALKIHYSAVHLKEMHKCTVEGCNMMFSSRRSRNRHSANPNPKLHMPTNKRKLPEGTTILDDSRPLASPPEVPVALTPPVSMCTNGPIHDAPINTLSAGLHPMPIEIKPMDISPIPKMVAPMPQNFCMPPIARIGSIVDENPEKRPKLDDNVEGVTDFSLSASDSKNGSGSGRRKRKSNVPTRCAQTEEIFLSDENSLDAHHHHDSLVPEDLSIKPAEKEAGLSDAGDGPSEMLSEDEISDERPQDGYASLNNSFHEIKEKAIQQMDNITVKLKDVCDDINTNNTENGETNVDNRKEDHDAISNHSSPTALPSSPMNGNVSDADSDINGSLDDLANNNDNIDSDIPLDKENPKKCSACGRIFQNHFSLKTHYQNVHLKLMHTCNVDGCNAAFPSKRSRDRHSANLNLHRKLLSTSSTNENGMSTISSNIRDEFLPRIYENQHFHSNALLQQRYELDGNGYKESDDETMINKPNGDSSSSPLAQPFKDSIEEKKECNGENELVGDENDSPPTDKDGMVNCHICNQRFRDNLHLKEHFEKVHPKEMFHCTIKGCDKIFSTRKSRNRHSQNENLHKYLSPSRIETQ